MSKQNTAADVYARALSHGVEYEANCTCLSQREWNRLMRGAVRADKRRVEQVIRKHCPELANDLALGFYNPYNAYRTDTHLIYVHLSIEYFLKINQLAHKTVSM